MLENDNIELTLVKLDNPHYANPHDYTKPAGQSEKKSSKEENVEDKAAQVSFEWKVQG